MSLEGRATQGPRRVSAETAGAEAAFEPSQVLRRERPSPPKKLRRNRRCRRR